MVGSIRAESHAALAEAARAGLPPRAGRPTTVVVGGTGIAGLVAAWELARAGHESAVLGARARVGGRIHHVSRGAARPPRPCRRGP